MSERASLISALHPNRLLQRLGGWRIGRSDGCLALLRVEGTPHQVVFAKPWRSF